MPTPPRLQALRVGQGYTATWTVTLRDERRRPVAAGTYGGSEALALVLTDPATGDAVTLSGSSVAWDEPDIDGPTIALTIDDSDTGAMEAGSYPLSISLTGDDGEPIEVFRAILRVEPRPPYS